MAWMELTHKEAAVVLLDAMLRKLSPTRSGRGLFIDRNDIPKVSYRVSETLSSFFYSHPKLKYHMLLEKSEFERIVELILFAKLKSLPKAMWLNNYIPNTTDALQECVRAVVEELDDFGLFGNIEKLKTSSPNLISALEKNLLLVMQNTKWLVCDR